MTTKQLSKEEIQQIFSFLKKNKVPYYDVQLEMVDHFATTIRPYRSLRKRKLDNFARRDDMPKIGPRPLC